MNIDAIKKLRTAIPIPIGDAKELLSSTHGDVDKAILLYKDQLAKKIVSETHCSLNDAKRSLEKDKYDYHRALSTVIENEYDKQFAPTPGVDKDTLLYARDWLYLLEGRDLSATLSYKNYNAVLDIFSKLKSLSHLTKNLQLAKEDYDRIFEGYTDNAPMEDFIKRNTLLDASPAFQKASEEIKLEIERIKDELRRQWRNLNK